MNTQLRDLYTAILQYSYPKMGIELGLDFNERSEWQAIDCIRMENGIRAQLTSPIIAEVKAGLANVVFWGNYQQGTVDHRVNDFLTRVNDTHLKEFIKFSHSPKRTPIALADCGIPVFSRMSFVSKVLMFLDPIKFVTLDLQLAKLAALPGPNVLFGLEADKTSIPISAHNLKIYDDWCDHCRAWASAFPIHRGVRAADVERGIFGIVQAGTLKGARPFLRAPPASEAV